MGFVNVAHRRCTTTPSYVSYNYTADENLVLHGLVDLNVHG